MSELTHIDKSGAANMVDVSAKASSERMAVARAFVHMEAKTLAMIKDNAAAKGDVLASARIAGIMGGKRTSELIPLCHPLPLSKIALAFEMDEQKNTIRIYAMAKTTGQTGVEMEALTAVSIAGLTIYDMCKSVDKSIKIDGVGLIYKSGGRSGEWMAPGEKLPDLIDV